MNSDSSFIKPLTLNMTADVAKKLYPDKMGRGNVFCDQHGEQPLKKVHSHLFEIRGSKDQWVCAVCVGEAQEIHETVTRKSRERSLAAKESKKQSSKDILVSAKDADVSLASKAVECQNATDALSAAKVDVEECRGFVDGYRSKLAEIDVKLASLLERKDGIVQQLLADDKALDESMTSLDSAHNVVYSCYSALQETVNKSDSLWASLSKNARKKRDRSNRKAAVAILVKREEGSGDVSRKKKE